MKITRIETHVCHARMRNWVFVKVVTDQDGLFGWGEATLEWHTRAVVGAIEDFAELLVGEDPTRVEHLWQMMYRQHFWHGHGIVRATAIAGIDLALWDILGKVARRAVLEALGRAGARSRPHLLPPRRRPDGRLLRDRGRRREALRRPRAAGGGRRLHGVQVHGRAADAAARRAEADPRRREVRGRDARGGRRRHRHHGRLPRPAVAGDGAAVREGARTVRAVLPRRAVLAGERRRAGRDQRAPSARRSRPASA